MAKLRLALLVGVLLALFAVFWVGDLVSPEQVRDWVESFGALAPLVYVGVAAGLGLALVPGPVLAGASGVLFGALLGTAVTLAASVLAAVSALLIARRAGSAGMRELSGPRLAGLAAALERHGLWAVVVQRLAPGVPDAPCSYLAGLLGIRVWQIALGTFIGTAPRAFSYTALGDAVARTDSVLGAVAVVLLVLTGLVGAGLSARVLHRGRRERLKPRAAAPSTRER